MQLRQIHTQPDPYAPYLLSQAIQLGHLVFVSGQAGVGDDGRIVGNADFDAQADQAFRNLDRALRAAGSGLRHTSRRSSSCGASGSRRRTPRTPSSKCRRSTRPRR
jgi:2-iminobutanoate/2-iminopropanoate deaminase